MAALQEAKDAVAANLAHTTTEHMADSDCTGGIRHCGTDIYGFQCGCRAYYDYPSSRWHGDHVSNADCNVSNADCGVSNAMWQWCATRAQAHPQHLQWRLTPARTAQRTGRAIIAAYGATATTTCSVVCLRVGLFVPN